MNEFGDEIHQHAPPKPTEHEWAHLDPSRWWFASSAFPMIAGTLGPVASAFSICALVKPWRQLYPPGTDVDTAPFVPDPHWLTAINAVQLAIAIFANVALLLNMTRRLSFAIAQPATIVGWYVSSITLVALTATASGPLILQPADEFIWSQAFYYGIYSAVLYFLVASLMVVTYMGAVTNHYPKDFMLTPSQRTLMLQTIMFLVYLLAGALVFSKIEDWAYLDAVYWAAVTLFTVGFGDLHCTTTLGRSLLLPYALVGIISLGLVIGSIRSLVLDRGKRRLGARMVEKRRRRTLRRMTRRGTDDILMPIRDDPESISIDRSDSGLTEFERREREFKLMRKIQNTAAHRRRWVAMGVSSSTWLVLWLVGAKVFQACEQSYQGWTYFNGVYFAFVSLTTIGYGDMTPVSNAGKSFWVFWALLALPTTTVLISNAGDTVVKVIRDATDQVATVTILPSEHGFKRDLKRLLRMLSCGMLFEEDIEPEPPGFLGNSERLRPSVTSGAINGNQNNDDAEETMQQDEADLEAEGGSTHQTDQQRAEQDQNDYDHSRQVERNAADEAGGASRPSPKPSSSHTSSHNNTTTTTTSNRITFSTPPSPSTPTHPHHLRRAQTAGPNNHTNSFIKRAKTFSLTPNKPTSNDLPLQHAASIPRRDFPAIPTSKIEYHITLIDEIRRVTAHLRHRPPRKYSFHEWAWYLRLIGEDEADPERHRKAKPHVHGRRDRLVAGRSVGTPSLGGREGAEGEDGSGSGNGNGKGDGEGGGEVKEKEREREEQPLPWSWVGSRSPLMGSQEEAEWILERLIARLGKELRAVAGGQQGRERKEEKA